MLGIVDEQSPFVGVLAASDYWMQQAPEVGLSAWPSLAEAVRRDGHAASYGGHDKGTEVRPIACFINADDPRHVIFDVPLSVFGIGYGDGRRLALCRRSQIAEAAPC